MQALKSDFSSAADASERAITESEKRSDDPINDTSQDEPSKQDVFIDDDTHDIRYKTLSWQV
jgi:hypothetical protein